MAAKKIAISLPVDVLEAVDELASQRGVPRSTLIAQILDRVARSKRDEDLRIAVDALFADAGVLAEQRETAGQFLALSAWREAEW